MKIEMNTRNFEVRFYIFFPCCVCSCKLTCNYWYVGLYQTKKFQVCKMRKMFINYNYSQKYAQCKGEILSFLCRHKLSSLGFIETLYKWYVNLIYKINPIALFTFCWQANYVCTKYCRFKSGLILHFAQRHSQLHNWGPYSYSRVLHY
jgi:hypothetical protein